MPEVEVRNLDNEVVDRLQLADEVFAAKVNPHLVWEAVRHYLAAQRRGTASTKTRGEVKGSGRKLWRQKGTGRARVGSIRSPLWRHGGTVFGPKPRDYSYPFPRKKLRGALRSILTDRLQAGRILVVESFELSSHKTKEFASVLEKLGVSRRALIVDANKNEKLRLSSRNLPGVRLIGSENVNVYDLTNHDLLLFSRKAILEVQERLKQ